MKAVIISDIHGNLEALRSLLPPFGASMRQRRPRTPVVVNDSAEMA